MTIILGEHSSIPTKVEVHNDRTTSGNTGDNKTREETFHRQAFLFRHNERGVGKPVMVLLL